MSGTVSKRMHVVDALRGFAIISIMLLHNIEHFDFYFTPTGLPAWMANLDKVIWDTLFFLFGGKSYAIFAFMFGLTFFVQLKNQQEKGSDFRTRFAWRLVLLLGFGLINSAFYQGDILTIYAIIGFSLIPVARLNTKTVFWIAAVLMLQPYEWYNFFKGINDPGQTLANPISWQYFGKSGEYIPGTSVIETWVGNLTNGKLAVYNWVWENGRVFQTASLFMLGMLAGRMQLFMPTTASKRFWVRTLISAVLLSIPLFFIKNGLGEWISSEAVRRPLSTIITSWYNLVFMLVLVASFVLLFQNSALNRTLKALEPIGRMSMSNYILQSVAGTFIYYGFGLGLYKYTGATYCLLIGIGLAILQGLFSAWWMKSHRYGPLEYIWHRLTWLNIRLRLTDLYLSAHKKNNY